jgi:hypothetical protein
MRKGEIIDQGNVPQEVLPCRIQLLQPHNQRVPNNIRVRIDEEIPIPPRPELPRLLRHVDILVLIQSPPRIALVRNQLGAVLLIDYAIPLCPVEIKLLVVPLRLG